MSQRLRWTTALVVMISATAGFAQEAKPEKKADPLVRVIEKLREPADFGSFERTQPLGDIVSQLEKKQSLAITFGPDLLVDVEDIGAQVVKIPASKLPLAQGLRTILAQRNLSFLVRKDGIELVTMATAAREAKTRLDENGPMPELASPLVSQVFVEKPLNEALAAMAEDANATIIVAPQTGDARTAFVSARLLNVPLDQAIEVLALQADLRVVRKGNAFLVTTQDHSNQLFSERLDRRRQQREAEAAPPPAEGK